MSPDEQKRKLANLRAADRRRWADDGHLTGDFPKWAPGMPTITYVQKFMDRRGGTVLPTDFARIGTRVAPWLTPEQDAVIVETEDETEEVLW